jgi:hypothetical protein
MFHAAVVPTNTNKAPYSRSASSSVSVRKVSLPIFLTSAMGLFESRRRAVGKGFARSSVLRGADQDFAVRCCFIDSIKTQQHRVSHRAVSSSCWSGANGLSPAANFALCASYATSLDAYSARPKIS